MKPILVIIALIIATASYAEIYRWVDKEGKVQFGTKKPTDPSVKDLMPQGHPNLVQKQQPSPQPTPDKPFTAVENQSSPHSQKSNAKKTQSPADGAIRITSDGNVGCIEKEDYKRLVSYAAENDLEAFKKALAALVLSGRCIMFKTGDEVFLRDTAFFAGMAQVRRRGDISEYWTNIGVAAGKN